MKKGYLLVFYLILFVFFLQLFELNISILKQKSIEQNYANNIVQFSLIESNVIKETIKLFFTYKMIDFKLDTDFGDVYVYYFDEIAYIKFDFDNPSSVVI